MPTNKKAGATHAVVDGSNIATEGRSLPSLAQLREAISAFEEEYPHDHVTVVVDATFAHRIEKKERASFEEAVLAGEMLTPPAGTIGRGDAFILQIAAKADANVFSNDSFQEFQDEHPWLFDEGRLIGAKPVPPIGWIFNVRSPVRAPNSKRRGGRRKKSASTSEIQQAKKTANARAEKQRGGSTSSSRSSTESKSKRGEAKASGSSRSGGGRSRRGRSGPKNPQPLNDFLPFIEFVDAHAVGDVLTGTISTFASHGAYATIDGLQCYLPLSAMGDPAPRSPRDVVKIDEERSFTVVSIDASRRGVDVSLNDLDAAGQGATSSAAKSSDNNNDDSSATTSSRRGTARKTTAKKTPAKKAAPKKSATKKTAAKKTTAKKAATKKTTAKKTAAKKAAPKKAATRKTTAKKAAAKKTTAKKTTAKKAATKKTAAKKTTAKKTAAKKRTAKKSAAK
jgi:hypothetical protein